MWTGVYGIVRGAILGIVVSVIANRERLYCFQRQESEAELYSRVEPKLPDILLRNLTDAEIRTKTKTEFLLRPWKLTKELEQKPNEKYLMVILCHVGVQEAKKRFLVRETWGSISQVDNKKIGVIFIAGFQHTRSQKLLSAENEEHGDILQVSSLVNEKTAEAQTMLAAFQWVIDSFGSRVNFVVTSNGNSFPFIPNIFEYLKGDFESPESLHCALMSNPIPRQRNPTLSRYISQTDYCASYFPSHCMQTLVVMRMDVMQKLRDIGRRTTLAKIPTEIYMWGVLREKMRGNGTKNLVDSSNFIKDDSKKPLAYAVLYSRYDSADIVREIWANMRNRFFTASDTDRTGKLEAVINRPVREKGDNNFLGKDAKRFLRKWMMM